MRRLILLIVLIVSTVNAEARLKLNLPKPVLTGVYLQWGYSRDYYTRSDIHYANGSQYNFTIHKAEAEDKNDFSGFKTDPFQVTIPQYVYRIGFYLNKQHTHAIEVNFDHAKYVVTDGQKVNVSGQIGGQQINWQDTVLDPTQFHLEHTNGANFYHINYVGQAELWKVKKHYSPRVTAVWKLGAGIVVPKSDILLFGKHLDNVFHVAGYIVSGEGGIRFYPARNLFVEGTLKGGFANYANVLTVGDGGRIHHNFGYYETIVTLGYDINLGKYRYKKQRAAVIDTP